MTIHKLPAGGMKVTCDAGGCTESYSREVFAPGPDGWTVVPMQTARDKEQHYCPRHPRGPGLLMADA